MSNLPCRLAVCSLLVLSLGSCIIVVDENGSRVGPFWRQGLRGSGVRADSERSVPEFHAIDFEAHGRVVVRVGEPTAVRISGDDNLLAEVETTVDDGVLSIELARSCDFRCGLEIEIATPSLDGFELEGSGDVEIVGVDGQGIELSIEGSGDLVAHGRTHELVGSIEGSGDLRLADLQAEHANLSIEGSGSMDVNVVRALHYSIEGSGSIRYAGDAHVQGRVEGSGDIVRRR
jgi:hypothetical protein